MNKELIHKNLHTSEIYDRLRQGHSLLKDVLYMEGFKDLTEKQINALETLSGVMYMTEEKFTDF